MSRSLDGALRETLSKRFDVLKALDEQPQGKPELVDTVGCSRSTVDRAVAELIQQGCVESNKGKYQTTPLGRTSLNIHLEYMDRIGDVASASEVLNENPNLKELPPDFLRQVTVSKSDPQFPESTLKPSTDQLRNSTKMLGLAPVVLKSYIDDVEGAVRETGVTAEIIAPKEMVSNLVNYRDSFTELVESGKVVFYTTDENLPYSLWIMVGEEQDVAGITVHQNGGVQGMLMNTSPQAIEWATNQYESFKSNAVRYQTSNEDAAQSEVGAGEVVSGE